MDHEVEDRVVDGLDGIELSAHVHALDALGRHEVDHQATESAALSLMTPNPSWISTILRNVPSLRNRYWRSLLNPTTVCLICRNRRMLGGARD